MTTKFYIKSNLKKAIILFCVVALYIILSSIMLGCASVDRVQEDQGWLPVGMREDSQDFYNSKYNTMDNGYSDPNANVRVFSTKY